MGLTMKNVSDFFKSSARTKLPPIKEETIATIRTRAEYAKSLIEDSTFQEVFQAMNEEVGREIASSSPLDQKQRDVLYLKLKLITEIQETLMMFISNYETAALINEAQANNEESKYG